MLNNWMGVCFYMYSIIIIIVKIYCEDGGVRGETKREDGNIITFYFMRKNKYLLSSVEAW